MNKLHEDIGLNTNYTKTLTKNTHQKHSPKTPPKTLTKNTHQKHSPKTLTKNTHTHQKYSPKSQKHNIKITLIRITHT
jgi:hypothetical protein